MAKPNGPAVANLRSAGPIDTLAGLRSFLEQVEAATTAMAVGDDEVAMRTRVDGNGAVTGVAFYPREA